MKKNNITNKITPCGNLPFSNMYWWISELTLNSEADRSFIISKLSQCGNLAIDGWKALINSGTLESDAALSKAEFLKWFDCERPPSRDQLKLLIEGLKLGNYNPIDEYGVGWTEESTFEEFGVKIIKKIINYVGGVGSLPDDLNSNIGKYYAAIGGYTNDKNLATDFRPLGSDTNDLNAVLKSFVKPTKLGAWVSMPFPVNETKGAYVDINNNQINSQYAAYGDIPATSLVGVAKLRFSGEGLDQFGGSIAWWQGVKSDGTFEVLKSGKLSSGISEITLNNKYVKYRYSRPTWLTTLEKQELLPAPIEVDSVMNAINLIGSGYSGVLDLATLGLKESNTAAENTTIINAAIESQAGKSDAKHIKFPGGSFAVNEISMRAGTAMSGAGRIHTRLYTPEGSTARFIINIQDGQRARGQLSDIFIDARNTTEGGIYLNNVYNFNLFDMVLYGAKQYCIWLKGGLMHSLRDIYILGADIGLKTSHLAAFATNLCSYDKVFFVQQKKKCVELNAGSDYRFTSCCFEDSGISGDETTGGVHAIGLSPYGEGVDVTFSNCWSEGIRGGFIYRFDNCKGNSVIEHCMLYNGGNGAGTIANAIVNNGSNVELSGATRFSTLTADSKPFPKNITAVGGSTLISNPNINVGTNNLGTLKKVKFETLEFVL